jgi:hypothetical protein
MHGREFVIVSWLSRLFERDVWVGRSFCNGRRRFARDEKR